MSEQVSGRAPPRFTHVPTFASLPQSYVSTQDISDLPGERRVSRIASPRNCLAGTVLTVKKDVLVAQVEMACGPYRIVSLMSREAADELDLKPGDRATAIIKSAAVFIEPLTVNHRSGEAGPG